MERRICNLAFFDRINVTEVDHVEGEPHWGMELMLNPSIQATALQAHQSGDASDYQAFTACVDSSFVTGWVDLTGYFSNYRLSLKPLVKRISRAQRGSGSGPRGPQITDFRGPNRRKLKNPQTELAPEAMDAVLAEYAAGRVTIDLEDRYGVARSTIHKNDARRGSVVFAQHSVYARCRPPALRAPGQVSQLVAMDVVEPAVQVREKQGGGPVEVLIKRRFCPMSPTALSQPQADLFSQTA